MMSVRQEDIAAENILKRAELNRITRQLKSRLSKTNLKSKLKEKSLSNSPSIVKSTSKTSLNSHITTPKRITKKRSMESIDANKTEDESSPIRNGVGHNVQLPPSSPLYEEFQIPVVPKTPPQQKITLSTDIYNSSSTNKTQINYSSPAKQSQQQSQQQQLLSTPKRHHDEGADLLMFLATSPSPVQYKNYPSTPTHSLHQPSSTNSSARKFQSNINSNNNNSNSNSNSNNPNNLLSATNLQTTPHKFATPATPKRNTLMNHHFKTPGFNMNDYVNLFSPSPRITRTPGTNQGGGQSLGSISGALNGFGNGNGNNNDNKDVNGKLIKF